ncbi:hypothetical protein NKR19_g4966 [Coniochaeta hoffmannii]|uniref:Uncharacterized protein n=1 Tax=Coniochaeta hoffmannii TaxID=91930 RepID=A0AA38S0F6_9PEZI|nr:hypothetical protein NKR19_g4966 [Coniochaeta hoffmannii]
MFEVPDAKRVRRDELYSSGGEGDEVSHAQDDAATRAKLNERLARMFSLDAAAGISGAGDSDEELPDAPADSGDQDQPAFEFRLFSTSGSAPKVVVADEDEGDGTILSSRPKSFHLKEEFTEEELARAKEVAVDYADIVLGAQQRAWGLEVPWRVTKITLTSGKTTIATSHKGSKTKVTTEETGTRKRPGKKRRVALRIKEKERKQKEEERKAREEEASKQRLTKEEHLREKKKRLNREKKLKRRQKEKEKKLAGKTGGEGAGAADGDHHQSSSGSDSEDS